MKHIVLKIYIFSVLITFLFAQENEDVFKMLRNPKPYLDEILNEIKITETSWEIDQNLSNRIRGLAYAINQEIISEDSKDWGDPSANRLKVIEKWGVILDPYTKDLLDLAMDKKSTRQRSSAQARSLLDFASPTEQFCQDVRQYLSDPSYYTAESAALILYEHRLLTSVDLDKLRELIKSEGNPALKRVGTIRLSYYGANDGIEIAREILNSKPESNLYEKMIFQYKDALDLMRNLGPAAESLLPDLDALMSKISESQPGESNRGILVHLQHARDLVTGKQPMQERYAANGSGPLPLKIGALSQQKGQENQSSKDTSRHRLGLSRPKVPRKASDAVPKENSRFPWGMIAGLIALLVVGLVAWLKVRNPNEN